MKDEQKRFGKGFAAAWLCILSLAAGLGIFGYRLCIRLRKFRGFFWSGGGGGAEAQEEEIEQEEQQEEPIIQSLEDIDQKLKPKPQKKVVRKKGDCSPRRSVLPVILPAAAQVQALVPEQAAAVVAEAATVAVMAAAKAAARAGQAVPRLLREVAPVYPASARNSGATGVVTVRILVGADGSVEDVTVVGSSGNGAMDNSVRTAVNKWRFNLPRTSTAECIAVALRVQ